MTAVDAGLRAAGASRSTVCRDVAGAFSSVSSGGMEPGSVVEAGSVTKVVTGLLLAALAEADAVALSDPVGRYLPNTGPAGSATVESLATHTSGLPRLSLGLLARVLLHLSDPYAGATTHHLVRDARRSRLRPSAVPHYSNLGVALLGQALARAAGSDYWTAARTLVLDPLGLAPSGDLPDTAAWVRRGLWDTAALAPAVGLRGPVTAFLRLAEAARDPGVSPLAEAIVATRLRVLMGADAVGLCWISRETPAGRVVWHNGGTGAAWAAVKPYSRLDAAMWAALLAPGSADRCEAQPSTQQAA